MLLECMYKPTVEEIYGKLIDLYTELHALDDTVVSFVGDPVDNQVDNNPVYLVLQQGDTTITVGYDTSFECWRLGDEMKSRIDPSIYKMHEVVGALRKCRGRTVYPYGNVNDLERVLATAPKNR